MKSFIFPKQVQSLTSLLLFLTASSCVWSSSICARKQKVVTKTHYKTTAYKYSRPSLLTTAERGSSTCGLQKSWLPYILSLINSFLWFSQHSPSSVTASVVPVETLRQARDTLASLLPIENFRYFRFFLFNFLFWKAFFII